MFGFTVGFYGNKKVGSLRSLQLRKKQSKLRGSALPLYIVILISIRKNATRIKLFNTTTK